MLILYSAPGLAVECPNLPADIYRVASSYSPQNSSKVDSEAFAKYQAVLKNCPGQLASLGRTQSEKLYFKGVLVPLQKTYEKKIVAESEDRYVDQDLAIYNEIGKALGNQTEASPGLKAIAEKARQESAKRQKACTTIDNRTPAIANIRNQGEIGWCYAYTAADLISHKTGVQASALDIAFQFNATDSSSKIKKLSRQLKLPQKENIPNFESSIEGGYIGQAVYHMKNVGVCKESDLPSNHHVLSNLKRSLDDLHRLKKRMSEEFVCDYSPYKKSLDRFPKLSLVEALQTTVETSDSELMKTLAGKNCKDKIQVKHLKTFVANYKEHPKDTFDLIGKKLSSGDIVGITYNFKLLNPNGSGAHASSLVGRQFNQKTGECEYLLRNSWGSADDKESTYKGSKGYYSIPASALKRHLDAVTYVE